MSVVASYAYQDGMIVCTIEGEGKPHVYAKPATPEEWVAFQRELDSRGFKKHGEAQTETVQ